MRSFQGHIPLLGPRNGTPRTGNLNVSSFTAHRPLLEGQLSTPLHHSIGQIRDETFQVATWEGDALTLRTNRASCLRLSRKSSRGLRRSPRVGWDVAGAALSGHCFFLLRVGDGLLLGRVLSTAAAAKSLQWRPTLCDPPVPGILTGVGCHFLLQRVKVKSESEVAQSCPTRGNPMDCSPPGSSVHGFSRQEHWSGAHCLLPRFALEGANGSCYRLHPRDHH